MKLESKQITYSTDIQKIIDDCKNVKTQKIGEHGEVSVAQHSNGVIMKITAL